MRWFQPVRLVMFMFAVGLVFPSPTRAFSPDLLISSSEFTDASAMSLADVQTFLQQQNSPLASLFLPDSSGNLKLPTEIIWFAAQEAHISPKVLLTTLQKEQRVVTNPQPTARQLDFAMGYGCPDGSGCGDRFRGFGKQVRGAALQFRGYLDDLAARGETIARWAVGRVKQTGDGFDIAPQNDATAALYSYTPWRGGSADENRRVGGNLSFTRIWKEWFGGGAWPDGTILAAPDGMRWLLQGGKRRQLATPAVTAIRSASASVVPARQEEIETYAAGTPIRFTDYTVVESADGVRWLLIGDTRRKIASREVFRKLGFNPEEVETIAPSDLDAYAEGAPIERTVQDPRGTLVQERGTKRLWLVTGGIKQAVLDPLIQRHAAGDDRPILRSTKELKKWKIGDPLRLPEGAIVTAPRYLPTAFIISRGERRPFASPRSLELLGYQWSDVHHVTNAALELHPLGASVDNSDNESPPDATQAAARSPASPPRYFSGLSIF